jgi:RNA polymerase sigma factor (sigma-70 family)
VLRSAQLSGLLPSDADLLGALAEPGEPRAAAWATLVDRHSPKMYAVARSFLLDAATAEDLVQTAWLRLVERRDQVRDAHALGPWLCTIVRNEARKLVTRRRTVPTDDGFDRTPSSDPAVETRLVLTDRQRAVRLAFERLGDDCRQLLRLVLADPPLSYDEVAATLGRPRGSLGPTRRRCLDQLRGHLPAGFEP